MKIFDAPRNKQLISKSLAILSAIFILCLSGTPLQALVLTRPDIQQIVISPDGQRIVYARKDWEGWPNPYASTGPQRLLIRSVASANSEILSSAYTPYQQTPVLLGFTPDADKLLATTPAQTGIAVIHNKTAKTLRVIPEPRAGYIKKYAVNPPQPVLSPDGSLLALGDTYRTARSVVYLMNTGSKKLLHTIPLSAHTLPHSLTFSHDGKAVFWLEQSASGTRTLLLQRYNFYQKKALPPLPVQTAYPPGTRLRPGANGRYLLFYNGGKLGVLDLKTGKEQATYTSRQQDHVSFADFISPQHYGFLLQTNNGAKWVTVNIQTQQEKQFSLPVTLPTGSIALSKNRRQLAVSSAIMDTTHPDRIFLFDTYSGKLIRRFEFAPE